ncbi:MAG: chorismate mutase [Parcubacteria group bacterium GW2011_GWE2_39_37]|uniref:Chorismate mutase n=1 Tax=Candidatus Falkowbacteria bacterium GW2011_GWF2_39_8 TaxID=1618642 RepID=A0A0G0S8D6_9BACT|nr:MAG: chorismate mutase [Parcubacteria group bacterium GW2011_GWE2_39_37]KKR31005.1 MAG: chorismate mutase [Candidatus Falkowbacteria bacterium GW2011_GWF2_39_8]
MLDKYRKQINKIDSQILKLFEQRFAVVEKVGEFKKKNNLPIKNLKREKELIEEMIKSSKLNPDFIRKLYKLIFNNSYRVEK